MKQNCDLQHQYRIELQAMRYAKTTIETYASVVKKLLNCFSDPSRVTALQLKEYIISHPNEFTQRQIVGALKLFYTRILNQPNKVGKIPYPKKSNYLPEVLSVNEVFALLHQIQNTKHRSVIQLIYSCALRISEVINIKITDINNGLVFIRGAKGSKDRMVPIPDETLNLLRTYYKQHKPKVYLFETQFGKYSQTSIRNVFNRARYAAQILRPKITPHTLRHSRAPHWVENKMDIYHIQELLGHAKIETTTIYLHTAKQDLRRIMNEVDVNITNKALPEFKPALLG